MPGGLLSPRQQPAGPEVRHSVHGEPMCKASGSRGLGEGSRKKRTNRERGSERGNESSEGRRRLSRLACGSGWLAKNRVPGTVSGSRSAWTLVSPSGGWSLPNPSADPCASALSSSCFDLAFRYFDFLESSGLATGLRKSGWKLVNQREKWCKSVDFFHRRSWRYVRIPLALPAETSTFPPKEGEAGFPAALRRLPLTGC